MITLDKQVDTEFFTRDQGYEARGIVARINPIGFYEDTLPGSSVLIAPTTKKRRIYRYLTLDCGPGKKSFAVEFVRQADVIVNEKGTFLDATKLKPGEIVVSPGFVYKKIPWTTAIFDAHTQALKNYRPKQIIKTDVDKSAPAIDLGAIDPNGLTKQ